MSKFLLVLILLALLSVIAGSAALALNQFVSYEAAVREAELAKAASECAQFDAPHAILSVKGEVLCYTMFEGTERVAPLSWLRDRYGNGGGG